MTLPIHTPVLLIETVEALAVQPGGRYIDCTIGTGGHAIAILERSSPGGQLLGIDADPVAIEVARARLGHYGSSVLLVNENFVNLQAICHKYDFLPVHGILFDLGLSSLQLESGGGGRGFSFQQDAPLDMRFSPHQKTTAADILNTYSETGLANLIATYGEERYSRQIARRIVAERPITSTLHLVQVIERAAVYRRDKIHPATRTFQALRIAVNHELQNLESALKQAIAVLGAEGRLVVISYHSLEDRIVKRFMQQESKDCLCPPNVPVCACGHRASIRMFTKKALTPSPAEVRTNPRSRSAKLRAAEQIMHHSDCCSAVEDHCPPARLEVGKRRRPSVIKKLRIAFSAM
ncbi:MAG: 16S rRNA (cytosine(1402)-N(4))-methyltransferase RsmH [Chloroflexi bacterium]|nr:16S rRNA (cytosine(1402)-N(4))-methyltransferase RsmH [Chloroflexota bacterium]